MFVYYYQDMPGLGIFMVYEELNIDLNYRPIKQIRRNFYLDMEKNIKEEVEKLIRIIKPIIWFANIKPI